MELREGLGINLGERKIYLLAAYLDIVIEHHAAIDLLVKNERFGSAFALLRPVAETIYRSAWVNACATSQQLDQLVEDDNFDFPKLKNMMEKVDLTYSTDGFFQNVKSDSWKAMCSYAHSGLLQITRRFGGEDGHIGPNYSEAEILEVLKGSSTFLFLLAILFFKSTNYKDQASEIEKLILN